MRGSEPPPTPGRPTTSPATSSSAASPEARPCWPPAPTSPAALACAAPPGSSRPARPGLSLAVLIRDLGRPGRFVHMLRVVKPTSPMSIGTWLLSGFSPLVAVAALDELSAVLPRRAADLVGVLARPTGLAATVIAPTITTYTGALIANTAVPVWHEAHRELPYLFGASALAAAGGLVAATSPAREAAPARLAGGVALAAASALTKFGYFPAGTASAEDPKYTVLPQRERATKPQ
ncbi:NrfD/PsrC family molybdoenzyme membrane anchor subunit [Micromonospora sp. SL4-19]|uniref:NrfD/PsrC family molybdoenzyme membrane anchor subunit n=1 Tax=Micromonospora sp. SL4-19 TaxID=3399129 RepID=UPI003A4D7682